MFMNREQKYHFPIGRRQKNNHCCSWIVNKTENSYKSVWKTYINCRNVNESNTIKYILSDLCSLLKNKRCGLYFVLRAKIYFVSFKNFSSVEKHFVSQKKFFGVLVVKSILFHRQKNIYGTGAVYRKKCRGKSW